MDFEAGAPVRFVVEVDSELGRERLDAVVAPSRHMHDAFEDLLIGDISEVDVDVQPRVGTV